MLIWLLATGLNLVWSVPIRDSGCNNGLLEFDSKDKVLNVVDNPDYWSPCYKNGTDLLPPFQQLPQNIKNDIKDVCTSLLYSANSVCSMSLPPGLALDHPVKENICPVLAETANISLSSNQPCNGEELCLVNQKVLHQLATKSSGKPGENYCQELCYVFENDSVNPLCTRLLAVYDILVGQKIVTKANAAPTANPPLNNIPSAEPEDQRGSGSVKKNDPEQDKDKLDQLQPPGDQSEASKVETEAEVVVTEPHGKDQTVTKTVGTDKMQSVSSSTTSTLVTDDNSKTQTQIKVTSEANETGLKNNKDSKDLEAELEPQKAEKTPDPEADPPEPQVQEGQHPHHPQLVDHMPSHPLDSQAPSHLLSYFFALTVVCIAGYLIFHNKQKLFALILEGRRGNGNRRRGERSRSAQYRKLDNNLEEAMGPNSDTTFSQVVY